MKDFKVAGFPLPLYVLILALTAACMFTGCVPKSLVPAFLVLMVFGEGLNAIGNNVPVVKTYLGGSVICILGSAILTAGGLIPEQTLETLDYFVNDSGFLIFYIAALICGSLFNIDRNLLLRATVKLLPVAVISLSMGILLSGIMGIILGEGFWGGILYIGVPMTSGGMTAGTVPLSAMYSQALGVEAADVLTKMAPATVLGNCVAIIFGGLLNNFGKKHPETTGNGVLVNDGKTVKKTPPLKPTFASLCTGMIIAFAFYQLGAILHRFVPVIPTYAWMIIAVVLVKGTGIMSEELEDPGSGPGEGNGDPVRDPGGRGQRVGAVCHQELDGGGTCGDRFYPDRSEYNFKDSDTVISDHGGAHRGDHYVYGVSSWKAGWLFPTGISHRSGDVYNKYGWFRQCSCFEQCT